MPRRRRPKNDPTITLVAHLCVALFSATVYLLLALVKGLRALFNAAPKSQPGKVANPKPRSKRNKQGPRMVNIVDEEDIPLTVKTTATAVKDKSFKIPKEPAEKRRWVSPGEVVEVAGLRIEGGMIYVGASLTLPGGGNDPSLIIPRKPVADKGDFTKLNTGYGPRYEGISAEARRAYLNWLAQGRKHPDALIGYVFIYFYGLERRVLVDAQDSEEAKAELPLIAQELERLMGLYGSKNASFFKYAQGLLDYIIALTRKPKSYLQPLPEYTKSASKTPLKILIALGQAARDKVPVPAEVAFAWLWHHPNIKIKPTVLEHQSLIQGVFRLLYKKEFGEGLVWAEYAGNHHVSYQACSTAFQGRSIHPLELPDVQRVADLNGPLETLRPLLEQAIKTLKPGPTQKPGRDVTVEQDYFGAHPATWPDFAKAALTRLVERTREGMVSGTFEDVFYGFRIVGSPNSYQWSVLSHILERMGICVRPNFRKGEKTPTEKGYVVLFEAKHLEDLLREPANFYVAQVMLEMAAALSNQFEKFTSKQTLFMCQHIEAWKDITPLHLVHLAAHLRYVNGAPSTPAVLKNRAKSLEPESRQTIAAILVQALQIDSPTTTPAQVKMLEKLYNWLGLDEAQVFSDIHTAQTGGTLKGVAASTKKPGAKSSPKKAGFSLDYNKVQALQKDTEKVSELLSGIFTEEEEPGTANKAGAAEAQSVGALGGEGGATGEQSDAAESRPGTPGQAEEKTSAQRQERPVLPGLDFSHNALARLLLAQPSWSREELQIQAKKMDLMLDGALEQLNEACFDAHDAAFTEGDDPIEVNPEMIEILKA